jgi:hypothetical protein
VVGIVLTASGFGKIRESMMAQLVSINVDSLQRGTSNVMALIMKTPSVL